MDNPPKRGEDASRETSYGDQLGHRWKVVAVGVVRSTGISDVWKAEPTRFANGCMRGMSETGEREGLPGFRHERPKADVLTAARKLYSSGTCTWLYVIKTC